MYKDIYVDSGNTGQAWPRQERQIHHELVEKENKEIFQIFLPTTNSFCPIPFAQIAHQCGESILITSW